MRFHIQGETYQFKALPFGLSTAHMEFTVVAKEVKLLAMKQGIRTHQYLDDWLVRVRSHQTCLQHTQTLVGLCRELGWLVNEEKSAGTQTSFQFRRLPVRLERGQGQTHTRMLAGLTDKDREIMSSPVCPTRKLMSLIGLLTATEKQVHLGRLHMRPTQWHELEGTRDNGKDHPHSKITPPTSSMVAGGKQCYYRSTITPSKTCSANLYRHIKRRVGRSLKRAHSKGKLVAPRKQTAHKLPRVKGSFRPSVPTT